MPKTGSGLYRRKEGHPDWDALEERASLLVREVGESADLRSTPAEHAAKGRRVARGLATFTRSAWVNHRRLRRGEHFLMPPYFIWTMHNRCNFRCTYCDNHAFRGYYDLPEVQPLDLERGKRLLEVVGRNVSGVYFCGGEPTLHENLPEYAEHAARVSYFPIMINTNGSRFHRTLPDPRYSRLLKNLDIVIVSLDALDLDRLAEVWAVKRELCEQVIVNILALRSLQEKVRFKLMVNTVITPETIEEADAILDWANERGIWYSPVPMNHGPGIDEGLKSNPAYAALCDKIIARKKAGFKVLGSRSLIEGLLTGRGIKCFPSLIPHVDGDGHTYWPCKAASQIEPVKLNVLDYNSFDSLYRAAERMISVRDIHGSGPGQCGADCQWMQNYVSDALARGMEHPLSSGALREIVEFIGAV